MDCQFDTFYREGGKVVICPEACAEIQADPNAKLAVRYGYDAQPSPHLAWMSSVLDPVLIHETVLG